MIYFDHAATSMHKPTQVYRAVLNAMQTCASVGRSGHEAALRAADIAYRCRLAAGSLFDALPDQVVFTHNATHALNIAIHSLVAPGDKVLVSGFEHNAVMRPLAHIGADICIAGRKLFDPVDTLESFEKSLTDDIKAVICTHVSNVFGYILPVQEIAGLCRRRGIPLIIDAAQSAGVLPVSLKKLGAAYIAMPGHKSLLGPQGTGILLCGQNPKPLLCGGTGSSSLSLDMPAYLPDAAEVGTHNVPGIAGLLEGLNYLIRTGVAEVQERETTLLKRLRQSIRRLSDIRSFFGGEAVQTGVLSVQAIGKDCEFVAQKLAEKGIAVRAGLHCAPFAHASAGTIEQGTIRISFSAQNTEEEIDMLYRALERILS